MVKANDGTGKSQFKKSQSRPFRGFIERARPRVFFSSLGLASDSRRGFSAVSCHLLRFDLFFLQLRELLERAGPILVSKIQPHTAQTPHSRHSDLQLGARFPPADRKLPTALPSPLGTGTGTCWEFAGEYGQAARIRNSGTQNHKICGTSETLPAASSGSRRPAPTSRPRAGTPPRTRLLSHTSMDQQRSQRCRGLSW